MRTVAAVGRPQRSHEHTITTDSGGAVQPRSLRWRETRDFGSRGREFDSPRGDGRRVPTWCNSEAYSPVTAAIRVQIPTSASEYCGRMPIEAGTRGRQCCRPQRARKGLEPAWTGVAFETELTVKARPREDGSERSLSSSHPQTNRHTTTFGSMVQRPTIRALGARDRGSNFRKSVRCALSMSRSRCSRDPRRPIVPRWSSLVGRLPATEVSREGFPGSNPGRGVRASGASAGSGERRSPGVLLCSKVEEHPF